MSSVQWAVLLVIPAHEPDSHHKGPIVFTGWIGSHSACHSAATCITRRHSGACFCFWVLHTEPLCSCLWSYFTVIWEFYFSWIFLLNSVSKSNKFMGKQLWQSTYEIMFTSSRGQLCLFTWVNLFVRDSKSLCVCVEVITRLAYNLEKLIISTCRLFASKQGNSNVGVGIEFAALICSHLLGTPLVFHCLLDKDNMSGIMFFL